MWGKSHPAVAWGSSPWLPWTIMASPRLLCSHLQSHNRLQDETHLQVDIVSSDEKFQNMQPLGHVFYLVFYRLQKSMGRKQLLINLTYHSFWRQYVVSSIFILSATKYRPLKWKTGEYILQKAMCEDLIEYCTYKLIFLQKTTGGPFPCFWKDLNYKCTLNPL